MRTRSIHIIVDEFLIFSLAVLLSIMLVSMTTAPNNDFIIQGRVLIKYIGNSKNIVVPEGIDTIDSCAFKDMTFISSVTLPNTVVYINYGAFANCSNLEKINLPNKLEIIGSYAFRNCFSLEDIIIPDSVISVGDSSFEGCTFLKINSLPPTVQNIGKNIFKNASNVYAKSILEYNKAIADAYRTDDKALKYYTAVNYQDKEEQQIVEELVMEIIVDCNTDYEKVIAISNWVSSNIYYDMDYAYNNKLPYNKSGSIKEIIKYRTGVCSHYANLTMILIRSAGIPCEYMIGSTVSVDMGGWSFDNIDLSYIITAHAWNRVYIDGAWIYVDTSWNSTNEYIDGKKVTKKPIATYLDASLKAMSRGHKFEKTDESIFSTPRYTDSMVNGDGSIIIPDWYDKIADWSFADCTNLTNIVIPNTITSIGEAAFYNCTNLTDIIMPRNVDYIGNNLFYGCTNLTNVTMPVTVPDSWKISFRRYTKLKNVILPENITSIKELMFEGCTSLQNITIPNGVTSIGMGAFANCSSLTAIYMPDSIVSIGANAFYNSPNLTVYAVRKPPA